MNRDVLRLDGVDRVLAKKKKKIMYERRGVNC